MRLVISIFMLLVLSTTSAYGYKIKRFKQGRDLWRTYDFVGLNAAQVKAKTKADFVVTLTYIDINTKKKETEFNLIDYFVVDGKVKEKPQFPSQRTVATFTDGLFRIFPNYWKSVSWGSPVSAASLKTVPPEPSRRCPRQFWYTKGKEFGLVTSNKASYKGCLGIIKKEELEIVAFADGGHSVSTKARHRSFACVFVNELVDHKRSALIASLNVKHSTLVSE